MRPLFPSLIGVSGIYCIENSIDNKKYVGKSSDLCRRFIQYRSDFKRSNSRYLNRYLLNAMNKYGFDSFLFYALEECDSDILADRELWWMLRLRTTEREYGYNLRLDSSTSTEVSEDTKALISKRVRKEWSDGKRASHSDKMKINWRERSPEARIKQSNVMRATLTKYRYTIEDSAGGRREVLYSELRDMHLHSVLSSFHRKGVNKVELKGYTISREAINV